MRKRVSGLYLILDQQYSERDIFSVASIAVDSGVDVIQYREKVLTKRETLSAARRLRKITQDSGVTFIVNDDPCIAFAVDADGVHLGQEDVPVNVAREILGNDKIIGLSTHNDIEVNEAVRSDADYIGFGPIFTSSTKMVSAPHGVEGIRRIRDRVSVPLIAIGGIDIDNVTDVIRAGSDGIAVISSILASADIQRSIKEFKNKICRFDQHKI